MGTRRPSGRSSSRRGRWSDLSQRLAVLRPPATQQLHHILGTFGHSGLNAQSVPQLLRQQLRAWEKGVSPQAYALPCPSSFLKASPGSGEPLASRLLIFIRSRATFSWLSRSICWAAARSFLPCGVVTYASPEPPWSDQGLEPSLPVRPGLKPSLSVAR